MDASAQCSYRAGVLLQPKTMVSDLVACHECDLLQRCVEVPRGRAALCRRCGAVLFRNVPDSIDRTLAFTLAAALIFVVANAFPIVGLNAQGKHTSTTLFGAAWVLHKDGMDAVALLFLFTTTVLPAVQLLAMLAMLIPLRLGHVVDWLPATLRLVMSVRPWAMTEVFLLGTVVSLAKLAHMAEVEFDTALWAFCILIVLLACASTSFDTRIFWNHAGQRGTT
jgi:paraquat-inducible protein A